MIADARQKSEALITDAQTRSETQLRQAKEKADALQADAEKQAHRDHGDDQPAASPCWRVVSSSSRRSSANTVCA